MDKLIKKWKTKFSQFGNLIECHTLEEKKYSNHLRDAYNDDIYYAFLNFTKFNTDYSEIENSIGHKFPADLKKAFEQFGFLKIEDDNGNFYNGFTNVTYLNDHIEIERTADLEDFYTKEEIYLVHHGFSIGKLWNSDDSVLFIAFNEKGEPFLGSHNHDDFIQNIEPYTLDALLKIVDDDLEEFYKIIVENFEDEVNDFITPN